MSVYIKQCFFKKIFVDEIFYENLKAFLFVLIPFFNRLCEGELQRFYSDNIFVCLNNHFLRKNKQPWVCYI